MSFVILSAASSTVTINVGQNPWADTMMHLRKMMDLIFEGSSSAGLSFGHDWSPEESLTSQRYAWPQEWLDTKTWPV